MQHGPFEDVFPIENGDNGDIPFVSLPEGTIWGNTLGDILAVCVVWNLMANQNVREIYGNLDSI